MQMTIGGFFDEVKELLDVAAQSSYTDAQLCRFVVDGLRRLYAVRPATRYVDGQIADPAFPSDTALLKAFSVDIEPRFRLGVVYYAAGRAHEVGVTDTVNLQLAQTLKKQGDDVFMS